MTAPVKISACVDCATPIIGERPRCPACHQQHAALLVAAPWDEEDVTSPRPRDAGDDGVSTLLARWLILVELFVIVALVLIVGVKGCLP